MVVLGQVHALEECEVVFGLVPELEGQVVQLGLMPGLGMVVMLVVIVHVVQHLAFVVPEELTVEGQVS